MAEKLEIVVPDGADEALLEPLYRVMTVLNKNSYDWIKNGTVGLELVDDAGIRAFNKEYSGQDEITDVLSFDYLESNDGIGVATGEIGDIVISLETAQRQAVRAKTSLADEIALLGLHGILHLHGFDHAIKIDQDEVDNLQSTILKAANVEYREYEWKD